MADFQFNTNLGPAAQSGTSLADMINTARGAQAYQQQQQLNPLQLQKAQMEIQQAQQINPLEVQAKQMAIEQAGKINPLAVREKTAQTGAAELGLNKSQAALSHEMFGGLRNDPDILNAEKNPQAAVRKIIKFESLIENAGVPREKIAPVSSYLMDEAIKNPKALGSHLDTLIQSGIGATGQQSLQTPQLTTGPGGSPATYQSGTGTLREPNIVGTAAPAANNAPTGVTPTQMGLQYPVRKAGDIRPVAPNEIADAERGAKYRNDLTTRQTDLSKSRRNLDEVIDAAGKIAKEDFFSTGVLGAATRTIKGALGDEKYKQLSKDLANVQISNMMAMGGSMETDAGKQLMRMASGDETYPPDVLKNIARRTYADLTNLDMQATAASKFAKKYGDSNLNTFRQQWSSNADSKVFEAMSLYENIKDPAKRKEEIDRLLGNNPEQRQQFFQKYNNIKKLTATGEL
jgi:hypothetical protein